MATGGNDKTTVTSEDEASAFQGIHFMREDLHVCTSFDVFCVDCDILICINCKNTGHLHHRSQTIAEAATKAKETLAKVKVNLTLASNYMQKNARERETDLKQLDEKKDLVEREVHQRHSAILRAVNKIRDHALQMLESEFAVIYSVHLTDLETVNTNITKLISLQKSIDDANMKNDQHTLVLLAQRAQSGAVDKLTMFPHLVEVTRPVHVSSTEDISLVAMETFIGKGEFVKMRTHKEEVQVKGIQCKDVSADATCFCVLPESNHCLLSFIPSHHNQRPVKVSDAGEIVGFPLEDRNVDISLFVTFLSRRDREAYPFTQKDSVSCLYSKSHTKQIFRLIKSSPKWCCIDECFDSESSHDPVKYETETLFTVICSGYTIIAFDASSTGYFFAVIFECESTGRRELNLYARPSTHPKDYTTLGYLSDVCFYTLHGEEMLLVADEAKDAIHVMDFKGHCLTFTRFLSPGCPLLLQPTALNTDHKGRLWVGCRGGRLVTFQPLLDDDGADDDDEDGGEG